MKMTAIDLGRARPADYLGICERDPARALAAAAADQIGKGETASALGVSRKAVHAWCRGDYRPTQAHADKMAELIGAPKVQIQTKLITKAEAADRKQLLDKLLEAMSRRELAAALGIGREHISKWVRGIQAIPDRRFAQMQEIAQGVAA